MLAYECVRSRVAMRAEHCKSRSPERLSLCPCAPAPFPHKVSSLRCGTLRGPRILPHKVSSLRCGTLWGPRKQGRFRAFHRNIPPQRTGVGAGALDPYAHSFGDVFDSHVYLFGDGTTRRSAKLAQRAFAPALASRGAYLRSRKLDEKLSRHGLGARRVALLAPRATFGKYWYPLDYVSARFKLFSRGAFIKAQSAPL